MACMARSSCELASPISEYGSIAREAPCAVAGTRSTNSAGPSAARSFIACLSSPHIAVRFATTRILALSATQTSLLVGPRRTLARQAHDHWTAEAGQVQLRQRREARLRELGDHAADPACR